MMEMHGYWFGRVFSHAAVNTFREQVFVMRVRFQVPPCFHASKRCLQHFPDASEIPQMFKLNVVPYQLW